jgi:hypothetical protein
MYYFRWVGTGGEFNEYVGRIMTISKDLGVDFKGVFVPTSEWNAVLLFEGPSFDKAMEIYKTYIQKYGAHPKIPVAKLELLYTFEELGYPK